MNSDLQDGGVLGAVLAGGLSRRMGGKDKSALLLSGQPLIGHVLDRIRGQVSEIVINASEDLDRFGEYGLGIVPDISGDGKVEGFGGPLVGILSVLEWAAAERPAVALVATFPTDTPLLPLDFVDRAGRALNAEKAEFACAVSGQRVHPVVALWPVEIRHRLRSIVVEDGLRRVDRLLDLFRTARVEYPDLPVDPFFNINKPGDLAEGEQLLARLTV
ncbi:MAG: molybdenum cofactor guanylyltransferase [Rhodospirillales bacterium]|nr:molybdenum cofactor guanylyltransferase [Rhodospirillales bacterium]